MRARRGVLVLAASLVLPLSGAAADDAPAAGSVTITSPSWYEPVSGDVDVTVAVDPVPGVPPTRVTVVLGHREPSAWHLPTVVAQDVPPGTCDDGCTRTVTVPTAGWTRVDPGQPDPTVYDGSWPLSVEVATTGSPLVASGAADVRNGRVQLEREGTAHLGLVGLDDLLTVPVRTTYQRDEPDRAARVLLYVAGGLLDAESAPRAPGDWTWTGSVAGLPAGQHRLRVVALDARGVASRPLDWGFVVDRGPSATVETPLPDVLPADPSLLPPLVLRAEPSPLPEQVWLRDAEIRVGGVPVGGYRGATRYAPSSSLGWTRPLPTGRRELTVVVSDSRGVERTVLRRDVEVDGGPAVSTSVTGALVHGGERPAVHAEVQAAATAAPLRSWTAEVDGVPVARGTLCAPGCPGRAVVAVPWPAAEEHSLPGDHLVVVTATDALGMTTVHSRAVRAVPGVVVTTTAGPATVRYGSPVALAARAVTTTGDPLRGAPVALQHLDARASTWRTLATASTDRDGRARVSAAGRSTGSWRLVVPARSGVHGPGTGRAGRTTVTAAVAVSPPTRSPRADRPFSLRLTSAPYEPVRLQVQARRAGSSRWRTVAAPRLVAPGSATAEVTLPSRGTWHLRAVRPGTVLAAQGTSARVSVPVG